VDGTSRDLPVPSSSQDVLSEHVFSGGTVASNLRMRQKSFGLHGDEPIRDARIWREQEHNQIVAGIFTLIGRSDNQAVRWGRLALVWLAVSSCATAQGTIVSIRSWGGGYGGTPESTLRLNCLPNLEGSRDERCQQFRAVLAAARQPNMESPGNAMGITPQWLAANVDEAVRHDLPESTVPHTPAQIALFRSAFTNPTLTSEIVKHFCCGTDDYPHARIQVFGQDTGKIFLISDSQNVFYDSLAAGGERQALLGESSGSWRRVIQAIAERLSQSGWDRRH